MKVLRLGCFVVASALLGCGGGDDGTTGPPGGNTQVLGSITLSATTLSLAAGNTSGITVVARDTDNGVIASPGSPSFSSTSSTIAEVDGSGNVLAVSAGSATINVSLTRSGVTKTGSVAVTVTGSLPLNAAVEASPSALFTPNAVIIRNGGSVTWNFGSLEHTVTFVNVAGVPASIPTSVNSSSSRTFNTNGNFNYSCSIHAGMSGQVVVR